MSEQQALKRRGLIAGAAALVAGIAAKQATQPVAAAGALMLETNNNEASGTAITWTNVAISTGAAFTVIDNGTPTTTVQAMVAGIATGGKAENGVYGEALVGVKGVSANDIGVSGMSTSGDGVYGTTAAAGQYAVLGQTLVNNSFGLTGIANGNGCAAFAGATTNAASFAAYFQDHVQIDGRFDVIGAGNKNAAIPFPDGTHRLIDSVESPECWVEDFGEGTLTGGEAEIKLEAQFAAMIHTEQYHVFLTEHGGHNGLHTTAKSAAGFVVEADRELATAKGKSAAQVSGTFSWRVVARPKTEAKVERLMPVNLAPKIDMGTLPKQPPPPPVASAPPKRS